MVRNRMHVSGGCVAGSLLLILGLAGCAELPSKSTETPETRAQMAAMVRERDQELSAMRAEVAATRIAAAKKEAEVQELRAALIQLRQEHAEAHQALTTLRQELEARRAELERVRLEREQLLQASKSEQLISLERTVAALTQELTQIKGDLARPPVAARPKSSRLSPNQVPMPSSEMRRESPEPTVVPAMGRVSGPPAHDHPGQITVQPGDTLSSLAKRHKMSVADLRQANQIEGDALQVGTVLTLPVRPRSKP